MLGLLLALSLSQDGSEPRIRKVANWNAAAPVLAPILARATHLEVFRLSTEYGERYDGRRRRVWGDRDLFGRTTLGGAQRSLDGQWVGIAHFPVVAADPTPPADLLSRLLGVLQRGTYLRTSWTDESGAHRILVKGCGPLQPVMGYRVQTPDGPVELLVCFGCARAALTHREATLEVHIDLMWRELMNIAFMSFPFDAVLNGVAFGRGEDEFDASVVLDFK